VGHVKFLPFRKIWFSSVIGLTINLSSMYTGEGFFLEWEFVFGCVRVGGWMGELERLCVKESMRERVCTMYERVHMSVQECVCVWEREREKKREREYERDFGLQDFEEVGVIKVCSLCNFLLVCERISIAWGWKTVLLSKSLIVSKKVNFNWFNSF
jgi:hypothetical protein